MTEQEALEILEEVKELDDTLYAYSDAYMKALEVALYALEEVQKYHEIGTVEECQEAINSVHKPYRSEKYYDTEPEYDPCEGCTVEGTNNEDFYWPGQSPCDHCRRR